VISDQIIELICVEETLLNVKASMGKGECCVARTSQCKQSIIEPGVGGNVSRDIRTHTMLCVV